MSEVLHRGLLEPLGGMQVKLRTIAREASLMIYREVALDIDNYLPVILLLESEKSKNLR